MKKTKKSLLKQEISEKYDHLKFFTMVELLVVISIIAMLAAMMMPALQKAKEQAREAQCTNNRRQYELAERMYENANEEQPSDSLDLLVSGKFLNTEKLMECPSEGVYLWIGERGKDIDPLMGCSIHYYGELSDEESGDLSGDDGGGDSDIVNDGDAGDDTGDDSDTGDERDIGNEDENGDGGWWGAVDPLTGLLFAVFAVVALCNIPLKDEVRG